MAWNSNDNLNNILEIIEDFSRAVTLFSVLAIASSEPHNLVFAIYNCFDFFDLIISTHGDV